MAASASATGAIRPVVDRDGPLPRLLFVLTAVTGLVDAISYLMLGRVFVANMTGNVVLLGFAVAGAHDFSIPASLCAIVAFLVGALAGGRLGSSAGHHRGQLLAFGVLGEIVLVGAALVVSITVADSNHEALQYGLIVLLALAMGLQNAVARRLAVPDLTTTVLTLTLTGLAADSTLAKGSNPRLGRRWLGTAMMFLGAAVGAVLVLRVHVGAVLAVALALLILTGLAAYRASSSSEPWTTGG
ncbi:MAG TPA: YoaK family protein [Burkholderiaceae bacterium]|jgi:uncharacterized membrane protein YoaK (UPF0700 family)|nr:YoaK family protein [Burkholderiaceae bacterium]